MKRSEKIVPITNRGPITRAHAGPLPLSDDDSPAVVPEIDPWIEDPEFIHRMRPGEFQAWLRMMRRKTDGIKAAMERLGGNE